MKEISQRRAIAIGVGLAAEALAVGATTAEALRVALFGVTNYHEKSLDKSTPYIEAADLSLLGAMSSMNPVSPPTPGYMSGGGGTYDPLGISADAIERLSH